MTHNPVPNVAAKSEPNRINISKTKEYRAFIKIYLYNDDYHQRLKPLIKSKCWIWKNESGNSLD